MITALVVTGAAVLAAWATSDVAREAGSDLALALSRAGIPQKVAAPILGLSEPQLTEQLAARQPMNFYRMVQLFEAFPAVESAFYAIRAERRGLCLIDRPDLAEIVSFVATCKRAMRRRFTVGAGALADGKVSA